MKYLIIDDNNSFAKALCEISNNESQVILSEKLDLNTLAIKIKGEIIHNNDLILININFNKNNRQEQKGIELLIWLRLEKVINHVILYSFQTLHELLSQCPKHLIATSKGTTFVQIPDKFKIIDETLSKLDQGIDKLLIEENSLKESLKIVFDNVGLKHRLANIYGLWFMFNTHNRYFPNEKLKFKTLSNDFIKNFDMLQLRIANYLIDKSNDENLEEELVEKIEILKTKIKSKNPQILYIDDKANIGWSDFFRKALFGNDCSNNLTSIIPVKRYFNDEDSIKNFFLEVIKPQILKNKKFIDCLLLDLRLADETGNIDNLDNLSGIKLLKIIHHTFPSLPVIMCTASNKAKSVKKIIDCGAEGLWTKPGLDELKDNNFYLESYLELLTYVNDSLNKYKTDTEKSIFEAQFQVETINESDPLPEILKDIDIILTDTNFWCNIESNLVNNHKAARKILNKIDGNKFKFVVVGDVLDELFRITQKKDFEIKKNEDGTETIKDNISLKLSAKYGLETITMYKGKNCIETDFNNINFVLRESTYFDVRNAEGGTGFNVISIVEKNHSYFKDIESANNEVNQRQLSGHGSLHADDTFQMLIPHYLGKLQSKNILFITDDFGGYRKIGGVPSVIKALRFKFGHNQYIDIPPNFNRFENYLKFEAFGKYCLIAHSEILNKICFSDSATQIQGISLKKVNKKG